MGSYRGFGQGGQQQQQQNVFAGFDQGVVGQQLFTTG